MNDLYEYENELYKNGINYIAGVDEVGRGPLIGPVVTACVILPKDFVCKGLTDSKKLSEKKRELFYDYIMEHALSVSVGMMREKIIDEVGDLIFACVNVSRMLNVDEEEALNGTIKKFSKRFSFIEKSILDAGKNMDDISLDDMNKLWEEAKNFD